MPVGQASLLDVDIAEEVAVAEQSIASEPTAEASTAALSTVTASTSEPASNVHDEPIKKVDPARLDESAPLCYNCGNQTQRAGTCYVCTACGSTTGCS
jgi:tRNA(Ile2) C34 agmatinyltransferase TiaS